MRLTFYDTRVRCKVRRNALAHDDRYRYTLQTAGLNEALDAAMVYEQELP